MTAPSAAKAVEDTAFYRSGRLLSRNDVGFEAERFSADATWFHNEAQQRLRDFPDNLLATATHDHKRGEDCRARLAVLSEHGPWLASRVEHWRELATPLRQSLNDGPAPSPADELLLYQTLLGSWPLELDLQDLGALGRYAERVRQWQQKALREAKLRSSWSAPNDAYEQACATYVDELLLGPQNQQLRRSLHDAAQHIASAGALNGLAQCLLRMTSPGVPDLYQGNEYWDLSLVDPDNRRPVDYAVRREPGRQRAAGRAAGALARWAYQAGADRPGSGCPPGPSAAVPTRRLPAFDRAWPARRQGAGVRTPGRGCPGHRGSAAPVRPCSATPLCP